ncbi:DUF222 domain-containing protein, partial [Nocardia sp. KC 131]|uniref:DUF222 domain-containing protein n=1 Tax=Nocardia arseniciresistens TaxID=3392119 RepID=UPI00398E42F6
MDSNPASITDPSVEAALSTLEAGLTQVMKVRTDTLNNPDRLRVLQRIETVVRALPGHGLELVAQIERQWNNNEFATPNVTDTIAEALHISPGEARARWRAAQDLAHR